MKNWLIVCVLFIYSTMIGQESESSFDHDHKTEHEAQHEEEDFKHFRVGLVLGHTYIANSFSNGKETIALPDFGLDLEYWVNERWGFGLHNELMLQSIEILDGDEEVLEREYPFVLTADLLYKPWKELVLVIGYGREFETNENLNLIRFGLEYEIEIRKGWDLSPAFVFDTRFKAYDTWALGIGIGKRF